MRKKTLLLAIVVVSLLTTTFAGIQTVKASPYVMVDQPWGRVSGINQPTEFTASGNGGTPPYTFQWYTTFLDPNVSPDQWVTVAVPGAHSSIFEFGAGTSGRYGISIRITDSKGEGEYQSFQPIGIVVTVQSTPITPSPSPTPQEPTVSFTLWHTDSPVMQAPTDRLAHIPAVIGIESPENQSVWKTNAISLKVDVASYFWVIDYVYYEADWLNGRHQIFSVQPNYTDALNASINVNFNDVPSGSHNITVYATTNDGSHSSANVSFVTYPTQKPTTTSTPIPPLLSISILSQADKTYTEDAVPISFSLSQPTEWIAYSLDGQAPVAINGNSTLTGLSNGQHTVTLYANGTKDNTATPQTMSFAVNVATPFPAVDASVAISIVISLIVVAIVLKKRKTT